MVSISDVALERPAWFVTASTTGLLDQAERFVREGIWENLSPKFEDVSAVVNSVRIGDRIAIKSHQRRAALNSLPFDSRGKPVHSMTIRATGVVISNPHDGRTLKVNWKSDASEREWFFYTLSQPIRRVPPEKAIKGKEWEYDALNRFTFEDEPQDIDQFLASPHWIARLGPTVPAGTIAEPLRESFSAPPMNPTLTYDVTSIIDDGCFLGQPKLEQILERLRAKRNIILQGPPGTGKTWLAKKLAYALTRRKNDPNVRPIQFHPNLSYEDFVRGWRPQGSGTGGGNLALLDGPFLETVGEARSDADHDYVMVIEEINRGNPASIFGEMLTLLECDKRNADEALALAYPRDADERMHIPPNMYVIGTMNTADRSIAMVDLALRRRFAFFDLEPMLNDTWREWVQERCGIDNAFLTGVAQRINALNDEVAADRNLGRQFCIGHSFVTPALGTSIEDPDQWFEQVVETEIVPLLHEYWFDDPDRVSQARSKLLGTA